MPHDHPGHDHDHGQEPPSDIALRVKALESVLVDKGLVDPAALDAIVDYFQTKVGPRNGARVVAKAWSDPAFRQRLRSDATAAIAELGYSGGQGDLLCRWRWKTRTDDTPPGPVCTPMLYTPWPVLGLPPVWYKSAPCRSRAVIDPRGVLA